MYRNRCCYSPLTASVFLLSASDSGRPYPHIYRGQHAFECGQQSSGWLLPPRLTSPAPLRDYLKLRHRWWIYRQQLWLFWIRNLPSFFQVPYLKLLVPLLFPASRSEEHTSELQSREN